MRANYTNAVTWIAYNDDDSVLDLQAIEQSITVALVADLFKKGDVEQVAVDVQKIREARVAAEPKKERSVELMDRLFTLPKFGHDHIR